MSPDERRDQGPKINGLRDRVAAAVAARKAELEDAALDARLAAERVDLTLPAPPRRKGSVHPTMQVMDEMIAIFAEMGFAVAEGPDIEDDFHNFTAPQLPAPPPGAGDARHLLPEARTRDGERKLLRTHTSPMQVRVMQRANAPAGAPQFAVGQEPPIRIVAPGRVYRCDCDRDPHADVPPDGGAGDRPRHPHGPPEVDAGRPSCAASSRPTRSVTRFRPHHFPFTEPSAEMDVQCDRSGGEIKIGEGADWLEILGGGMVHPNILRTCGLDPDEWQGFAFGLGVDRLAMLKYGMPDLRDMFAADVRWLAHYGFSAFADAEPGARG